MDLNELVRHYRTDILQIAGSHGASRVRLLGSVARGTATPQSDVDFLIDLEPGRTLFDLAAIKLDLEDLLGRNVDVLTEASISKCIRADVVREAVAL